MNKTIYVDGIGAVMIRDGVVRLDLMQIVQGEGEQVDRQKAGTLAISLPGLVRMHQDLSRVVQKLIDEGVFQKRPKGEMEATSMQKKKKE